jgi:tetratricopeptide (TPR) repeat protein
VYYL